MQTTHRRGAEGIEKKIVHRRGAEGIEKKMPHRRDAEGAEREEVFFHFSLRGRKIKGALPCGQKSQRSQRLCGEKPLVRIWGSGRPKPEFLSAEDMSQACVFIMVNVDFPDLAQGLSEVRNTHINLYIFEDIRGQNHC